MEAPVNRQRVLDTALYMVTLPAGGLHYLAPAFQALVAPAGISQTPASWEDFVPADWRSGIREAMDRLCVQHVTQFVPVGVAGDDAEAIQLVPWLDGRGKLMAVAWWGSRHDDSRHHFRMFHRSVVAQWIMDPRPTWLYLQLMGVTNPVELNQSIRTNPGLVASLREHFSIIDANEAAALLYDSGTIDRFKSDIVSNASDAEVIQASQAILSMGNEHLRQVYQTEIGRDDERKSLWISCEIPALTEMDGGMFISALNISPLKQAEQETEEREQFLGTVLRTVPDILMVFDFRHRQPIFQNTDMMSLLGYSQQDVEEKDGHIFGAIAHPEDIIEGESLKKLYAHLAAGEVYETTVRLRHHNGEWRHFYFRSAALDRDEQGNILNTVVVARDITDVLKAQQTLDEQQRLAAKVFENSVEAIYITDQSGKIVQVNKAFIAITGYREADVIGQKPSQLGAGWHEVNFQSDIKPVLDQNGQWSGEIMSRRASGEAFLVWMSISYVHDSRGGLLGAITSFRDITEAKSSEESIRKLAYYDPLTDLPNRMLFHDRLLQALQRANRNRHYIAILFLDLDGFKSVNDAFGHATGDLLLTETAQRLKTCIRSEDTVARMGGDEFIIILNALSDHETAESAAAQVAKKIIAKLNLPFQFDDKVAHIGTSIGIALYPDDAIKEEELVRMADTAMYHTKQSGKNGYQFYTHDMHRRAEMRLAIESELSHALLDDEFVLAFQPKLLASTQALYGFEALLRWQHPQKGLMLPSAFMRTLDDIELSGRIGEWVIYKACEQMRQWMDRGLQVSGISVNLFANQYHDGTLPQVVAKALHKTGIRPEMLTIEITERLVMDDIGFAYALLTDLKTLGVRIAIDDFATGMLSLQSLNRLPIDEIKIDRQFIGAIDTEKEQYRLVKAIISLANIFGMDVVAEGVERDAQLQALLGAECPKVQGYLFYKPLLSLDLDNYLETVAVG